ncbi:conserved Plasmodium protein, unknown function [Plasmodium ovale]|uniref:Uncharacterized protein n=1 Tax=Plasmodium ovale TaxID=36330 RepID=A0A1C3KMH6_PLAOA|nr:conserved Plasmodium protein, unknown function [Plasmodium ovale]
MIRIYPYPFSKYVKSLPDPPPAKSREIKNFEGKKYENDYNWLLQAKNNLKKCFHLCNICSSKFNYMRCLVKNSNVPYEYVLNDKVVKNKLKDDMQELAENESGVHLFENYKNIKLNKESHDVKSNVLRINSNKWKNNVNSNQNIPSEKPIKNSIIFSNTLNHEDDCLSFNDDVFIFLDDYSKINSISNKKNEGNYDGTKLQDMNRLKYDNKALLKGVDYMIIHIKRHFKNNISYFACKHVTMDDLHNMNDEDSSYDNVNIYMYDYSKEGCCMNDSVVCSTEKNELHNLTRPIDMNTSNEKNEKETPREPNNLKNIQRYRNKYISDYSLKKNYLNASIKEDYLSVEQINENPDVYNMSHFCDNVEFRDVKETGNNENLEKTNKKKIVAKKNYNGLKNNTIMKNLSEKDEPEEEKFNKSCNNEKFQEKDKINEISKYKTLLETGSNPQVLIEELNEKLVKRKNSCSEFTSEKGKNLIPHQVRHEEKKELSIENNTEYSTVNNKRCSEEVSKNTFSCVKEHMSIEHIFRKNDINKKKTANNVNIDELKRKLINSANALLRTSGDGSQKRILKNERKKMNEKIACYNTSANGETIFNAEVDYLKLDSIIKESNETNAKMKNLKNFHAKFKGNLGINCCDLEIKSFIIDEKEKRNNLKLLEQIENDEFTDTNKMDEINVKHTLPYLQGEQINQVLEKNKMRKFAHDDILYMDKEDNNKKRCELEVIENKEKKTVFSNSRKKKEVNKLSNSEDIYEKNINVLYTSENNTGKKPIYGTDENEKCNKNYKNYKKHFAGNNTMDEFNDITNPDKSNSDNSAIQRNNIYNSLVRNYKVGLKDCEFREMKNKFKEMKCGDVKEFYYHLNENNSSAIFKKKENTSLPFWNKSAAMPINKIINWTHSNSNKDDLIRKNKLSVHYLKNKVNINQKMRSVNCALHNMGQEIQESQKISCKKHLNNKVFLHDNNFIFCKAKEKDKSEKENEINGTGCEKERLNKELKKKLGNILNLCTIPNKINIHNKICTSDIEKINMDNNKVIYINNNYFFNVDKNNYNDSPDKKVARNLMKYNFKKVDMQFSKNKNDFYCFKYMSNVLSSSCTLPKDDIFSEDFEPNVLDEKIDKLNDLRKKHLLKKYLNEVLDRKKMYFTKDTTQKASTLDRSKLNCNCMENNTYDEYYKNGSKFDKKKKQSREDLYIKQMLSEKLKASKRNTKSYETPESPKKQDKIPKPLASQLEVNSLSHIKKTPSYPFEELHL